MTKCVMCGFDDCASVSSRWSFYVDRNMRSLNDRLHNDGGFGGYAYRDERHAWHMLFVSERNKLAIPLQPANIQRRVVLTRCYDKRQRPWDRDNLWGGGKVVVDALVRAGVVRNDDENTVEVHWLQRRSQPRGLHVLVEELRA